MLADLLHAYRVEIEHHPVIGLNGGDSVNDRDEVIGGDFRSDSVRVGVLRRAPHAVGGQQDSALEHEILGMDGPGEAIQERLQRVSDQVLLRRCARPSLCGAGACCGLDATEHLIADGHARASNA